jgi:capsular polysaccharide biosynthesis protein
VVLDPAFVPTRPEKPGKALIVVLAAGASMVLALIVAVLRALLDDRIYEEIDLARVAPVLAVVPRPEKRRWWSRNKGA